MILGSVDFLVEFHKVCLACFILFNSSFYFDSSWVLYFSELDLGCSCLLSFLALCDSLCVPLYFVLLCALDFVFTFMDFYNSLNSLSPESAFKSLACK